jgi:hypothetical protein
VIDPSRPVTPSDSEITGLLADWDVFISSVMTGMSQERAAVAAAIEALGARAIWFERFGGRDDDPEAAYLGKVKQCNVLVGLLGERYGKPMPSGYSATHAEYNEAQNQGLRLSMWVTPGSHDGRQTDFIADVGVFHTYGVYSSPAEVGSGITTRLREVAAEELSPWVKLGPIAFRASTVRTSGREISVVARIRDNDVYAAITRFPDVAARSSEPLLFTHDLTSTPVRVKDLATETTVGRTRTVELELTRQDHAGANLNELSTQGLTSEDITEVGVRVALLGEENPLGTMSFLTDDVTNPLEAIQGLSLSEDVVGPVVRVLMTETLVGSGRAERITAFRLGLVSGGRRRVSVSWLPRKRFINVDPEERHVEGQMRA